MGDLAVGTHIAKWQFEILRTCALARCHEGAAVYREFSPPFLFDGPHKAATVLTQVCPVMLVCCGTNSKSRIPFSSQKTVAMTLPADFSTLKF